MTPAINIRPGVGILALFPHMNYQPWFALGEFVDNALASYLANKEALRASAGPGYRFRVVIDVEPDGSEIRIWDNAAGIGTSDYGRAFVTAEPPSDATGLSQFGIGMKSASCWFAKRWTVRTTALGEGVERTVHFDVPRIVREQIDEMAVAERAAQLSAHFTEVRLSDLYKPPVGRTIGKMKEHLASIYREFTRTGEMLLEFKGEELTFESPKVLLANRWDQPSGHPIAWRKDVDFSLGDGLRVSGFAALRETGSTRLAGFALFRNRRLVVGSADETYRPEHIFGGTNSYRYQRLFGELHLEGFDVTHTKDGFVWGDKEHLLLDRLKKELDAEPMPLLSQAERYRSRKAEATVERAAARAITSTATAIGAAASVIDDQRIRKVAETPVPLVHSPGRAIAQHTFNLLLNSDRWVVTIDATNDPARTDWLQIAGQPERTGSTYRMHIRVSLANEFMRRFAGATAEDLEPLMRIAAGLAIAEHTARASGVSGAGSVRRNLNELLSTGLGRA